MDTAVSLLLGVCVSGFGCVCAFLVNSWCGQCVDKIPELHMEQLKTALANFVSNRRQNLMINQHKSKLNTHFNQIHTSPNLKCVLDKQVNLSTTG